jgi:hypoxanthine phosphoribosyltransferase
MRDTHPVPGRRMLLGHDISDPGRPFALVLAVLLKAGVDVRGRCLYSKTKTGLEPDLVWRRIFRWIVFPGSSLSPVSA